MGDIKIGRIMLGAVQTNCYFIYRESDTEGQETPAVIIDPADQGAKIYEAMKNNNLRVEAILLTHGHFDHILGVAKLRQLSHSKLYANEAEAELLGDENLNQSRSFGCECTATPDVLLKDGEEITLAGIDIKMISTPGHTCGSCCYYIKENGTLIS